MRIFIPLIIILLTTGCSGLADAIRKNQQKQQIYKQHASKYHASCQKEAFNYYPVAIVEKEKPKNLYKPQATISCTTYGNTTNCRDTTADYSGIIEQANITANLLSGNTYDANASSRNNHIKSCIDNNLRNDSSFGGEVNRVEYSSAGYAHTYHQASSVKIEQKLAPTQYLRLSQSKTINNQLVCFYGENNIRSSSDGKTTKYCKAYKRFPINGSGQH